MFTSSPTAFAFTFTIIIAFVVEMFVIIQVMFCPLLLTVPFTITFAPIMSTVSMYSSPSGKLSIMVSSSLKIWSPSLITVRL